MGNGTLDYEYLQALFGNDKQVLEEVEINAAIHEDVGPLAHCSNIQNFTSNKVACSESLCRPCQAHLSQTQLLL